MLPLDGVDDRADMQGKYPCMSEDSLSIPLLSSFCVLQLDCASRNLAIRLFQSLLPAALSCLQPRILISSVPPEAARDLLFFYFGSLIIQNYGF